MALSVLPIISTRVFYGLWDSNANDFIASGTEEEMYHHKNGLESLEQKKDNDVWAMDIVQRRIDELKAGGVPQPAAQNAVARLLPESYAVWQAAQKPHSSTPQP